MSFVIFFAFEGKLEVI